MAKEDLEELFKFQNESNNKKLKLNQIISICKNDIDLYLVEIEAKKIMENLDSRIEELKKYSLCQHSNLSKDVLIGNDSHKDYYVDQCENCKKVINEYSI